MFLNKHANRTRFLRRSCSAGERPRGKASEWASLRFVLKNKTGSDENVSQSYISIVYLYGFWTRAHKGSTGVERWQRRGGSWAICPLSSGILLASGAGDALSLTFGFANSSCGLYKLQYIALPVRTLLLQVPSSCDRWPPIFPSQACSLSFSNHASQVLKSTVQGAAWYKRIIDLCALQQRTPSTESSNLDRFRSLFNSVSRAAKINLSKSWGTKPCGKLASHCHGWHCVTVVSGTCTTQACSMYKLQMPAHGDDYTSLNL